MAATNTVTLIITHNLQPNQAIAYEAWLASIMPAAQQFPGHLGVHVIRPTAGSEAYNIVIRFDTLDNLYAWTNSDLRKSWCLKSSRSSRKKNTMKFVPNQNFGSRQAPLRLNARKNGSSFLLRCW